MTPTLAFFGGFFFGFAGIAGVLAFLIRRMEKSS